MSSAYLWSILREFRELEDFWFVFHGEDGVKQGDALRRVPQGLKVAMLRRLTIRGAGVDDVSVERLCCICPALEEMDIDGENRFCII
jgi:hypothetical protein